MIITIIAGAHKTGTTFLQAQFQNNFKLLLMHKIFYLSLSQTRHNITSMLDNNSLDLKYIENLMSELKLKKIKHLILFDENFVGNVKNRITTSLYPDADKRLKKLIDIFNEYAKIKIFLIVRNFPEYIISRYCEYIRHYSYLNFEDYFRPKSQLTWEINQVDLYFTFENLFLNVNSFFNFVLNKNFNLSFREISFIEKRTKFSVEQINILKELHKIGYKKGLYKKVINTFNKKPPDKNFTELKIDNNDVFSKLSKDYDNFIKNNAKLKILN